MDSTIIASLVGFITAVIGAVISHFLILRQANRQFAEYYRNKLFEKQLLAYEKLWSILYPTSKFSTENTVLDINGKKASLRTKVAKEFCDTLTIYFFSEHGLYLSKSTRDAFFKVRDVLDSVVGENKEEIIELTKDDKSKIRTAFNDLHVTIRNDLGLRALKFKPEDIGIDEKFLEP